ncbi:MAG: gamma carbonic anhydrase family protein [Bacteroidetes bacterium]|nr:gamma carbonic anhydrase family protein [Bacteroidota bacterium]
MQIYTKIQKGKEVFIAPNATVIGDVAIGDNSSVWFGAVIRGDNDKISIGKKTNVQDMVVIHVDEGVPATIGDNVTIGHGAIIHGASIGDNSLIGIKATVLNHAEVGKFCVIGAHTLVTERMKIPDYSLVLGTPAKIVKKLSPEQIQKLKKNAEAYVQLGKKYLKY